jgi:glucokinase
MSLIKAVEKGEVKFNETTANEMNVLEYKTTSTGHVKYEA